MGGRTARRPSRSPSRSPLESSSQPLLCIRPDGCRFASALPPARTRTAVRPTRCRGEVCGDAGPAAVRIGGRMDPEHASTSGGAARDECGAAREADGRRAPNPHSSYSKRTRPVSPPKLCTRSKGSLEVGAAKPGLPDYRHQRAGAQLPVVGHRDGGGPPVVHPLHHDVAAAPSHLGEAAGFEDAADLAS